MVGVSPTSIPPALYWAVQRIDLALGMGFINADPHLYLHWTPFILIF